MAAGPDPDWFCRIPDEICLLIFRHLSHQDISRCSRVCRRWNTICSDESLWRDLKVTLLPTEIENEQILSSLASRHPRVRSLSFEYDRDYSTLGWTQSYNSEAFWRTFSSLESVSFSSCSLSVVNATQAIAASCPKLHTFRCTNSKNFHAHHLSSLVLPSRSYKEMNLAHCHCIDSSDIMTLLHTKADLLASCLRTLEVLDMDGVSLINDYCMQGILRNCLSLKHLEIDGEELTDQTTKFIGLNLQKLDHLTISFCDKLTDKSLHFLGHLKHLKSLYLKRGPEFSNAAFELFFEQLSSQEDTTSSAPGPLLELSLIECTGLQDPGLKRLAQSFPQLTHLDLSWCWDLTDKGLMEVATHCCKLESLKLVGVKAATCAPILQTPSPRLRYLDLVQTDLVDDEQLSQLKRENPQLKILDYYGEEVEL